MDIFAHGLWTALAFSGQPRQTQARAIVWGVAPDLIPFTISVVAMPFVATGQRSVFLQAYPYTHSLVIFAAAFCLVALVYRKPHWPMLAWGFHVLVDIPGHRRFLTPFLFPVSDFRIYGFWEWLSPSMLFVNYAAISAVMILIGLQRRRAARRALAMAEVSPERDLA